MNKGVGFNRNIFVSWLDATASFCAETDNPGDIRARLRPLVSQSISDADSQRKAIDILINIWVKTGKIAPDLRDEAVGLFQAATVATDRLWLHYGLTILYYPFFRQATTAIGQLSRSEDAITPAMVKARLVAEFGQLGSIGKAVERVIFSLRDWGIMRNSGQRYAYVANRQALAASNSDLEIWLLACALCAHPAQDIAFADLLRLPDLFPFRFTVTLDKLRDSPRFSVQRQGAGWDMVRIASLSR